MSNELDLAEQLLQQAIELCDQDNYQEALPLLNQASSITREVESAKNASLSDAPSLDRATLEASMAVSRRCKALKQGMEKRLEQILILLEQIPDPPELGQCLHSLGALYLMQHQYAKALPFYLRTLAIWEKTLEPEDPELIQCLTQTAFLLRTQERHTDARPLLERVLPIQEQQLGPEDPGIAGTLSTLASVYCNQGKFTRAAALYERALAIREIAHGPEDPFTTTLVSNLAYVFRMQRDYAKALPLYERFLVSMEATVAVLDKKLEDPSGFREGMNPILEIIRKDRDLCLAEISKPTD